jgi:pilus assembly protein CpaF
MVLMAGYDLPLRAIRQQIASALDLIVHIERLPDGSRRVVGITEVQRMESDIITLQDLFVFEVEAVAPDRSHEVRASLKPTGLRPTFLDKFTRRGVEIPEPMSRPGLAPRLTAAGGRA